MKRIIGVVLILLLSVAQALAVVSTETTRVAYTCNGTATSYAYTFKVLASSDILAVKRLTSTGAETTLTLTTDYSVTGVGGSGGNVVLKAGSKCASGYTLTLMRNAPVTQLTDYVDGEAFSADSLETALDKVTMTVQQQKEALVRTPKLPKTSAITDIELPNPTANGYIGWNAGATSLENKSGPVITTATQYEVDALVSYGGGTSYTSTTINAAITSVGSGTGEILIRPGNWVISAPVAFTAKIKPKMAHGAYFTCASAVNCVTGLDYAEPDWFGLNLSPGSTNMKLPIEYAIGSLTLGGTLQFRPTAYEFTKPSPSGSVNNLVSNIIIQGVPGKTILTNSAGNDNLWYAIFTSDGKTDITIRDLVVSGAELALFQNSADILVENVGSNGKAGTNNFAESTLTFNNCDRVKVNRVAFVNNAFHIHIGNDLLGSSDDIRVTNSLFKNTELSTDATYPVGVYLFYATNVVIDGNTFIDILPNTNATQGYGIYEGDGVADNITITNNHFFHTDGTIWNYASVFFETPTVINVSGNTFVHSGIANTYGIAYSKQYTVAPTSVVISNNIMNFSNAGFEGIVVGGVASLYDLSVNIFGNSLYKSGIHIINDEYLNLSIANNIVEYSSVNGISLQTSYPAWAAVDSLGVPTVYVAGYVVEDTGLYYRCQSNHSANAVFAVDLAAGKWKEIDGNTRHALISGNKISYSARSGISLAGAMYPSVYDNTIINSNTGNSSDADKGQGVYMGATAYGAMIFGNKFINSGSAGYMRYGIYYTVVEGAQTYKTMADANYFYNMKTGAIYGGYTAQPTVGIGWAKGDKVYNASPATASTPGWECVYSLATTLVDGEPSGEDDIKLTAWADSLDYDVIGVALDSGTVHWSTIASNGGTQTPKIAVPLTGAAAAGNAAYVFRFRLIGPASGTIDAAHGTTETTVTDPNVTATSKITLAPTNAIAAGLTGVYVKTLTAGVSFTVGHSDPGGGNHGSFNYIMIP